LRFEGETTGEATDRATADYFVELRSSDDRQENQKRS
jgi:hypothetical protein